jgi:DNA-directed RNA polymerase beta subunit
MSDEIISDEIIWKMIDIYFRDNPQGLVRHHIESYNDFLDYDLSTIFRETNPLKLDL